MVNRGSWMSVVPVNALEECKAVQGRDATLRFPVHPDLDWFARPENAVQDARKVSRNFYVTNYVIAVCMLKRYKWCHSSAF